MVDRRLKVFVRIAFEYPWSPEAYGTDDPAEAARIDQENFRDLDCVLLHAASHVAERGDHYVEVLPVDEDEDERP